jgi:hypothetical protein
LATEAARHRGLRTGLALSVCLALAAGSLLVPSAPTTDPWGWIVWGREAVHLELDTFVRGAPSWKPLPVLATAPLSLLGDSAPTLWILVARAGGLLGLLAAYKLATRLGGPAAGVLAAAGVVLSADWLRTFLHGYSEPLAIGLLLFAVDRHLDGRRGQALALGGAVSLARPEAFPLTLLYGALVWRQGGSKATVVGVAALVPLLWMVPDWIGSGDPFHAGQVARVVLDSGPAAAADSLRGGAEIAPLPLSLAAVGGLAIALRRRDGRVLVLSALTVGWVIVLAGLLLAGYPASERFYALPAALVCVLGAVGAVHLVELGRGRPARAAIAIGLVLASLAPVALRAAEVGDDYSEAVRRARLATALDDAIEKVGPERLRTCGKPVLPNGLGWIRGVIAWRLDLPLNRIRGIRTTAEEEVEKISESGSAPASNGRKLTIRARAARFILFEPFGDRHVRLIASGTSRFLMAARAGSWRVLVRTCAGVPDEVWSRAP